METTMKLAIETYSKLTGRTFESIVTECLSGNKTITENIAKLMFSVS
tara:strand:- start:458 stop:598 length:141 start_codon:yes stop_codon:yes gene_type:complete